MDEMLSERTAYAIHVPDGVCMRRVYSGGNSHTFQVGVTFRFWGDFFLPAIALQFCHQFTTIWHDVKTADGGKLMPTQIAFAPHVSGLNAFIFPISMFSAPAPGPIVMLSLVPLAPIPYCTIREQQIPYWAVAAQRPPAITTKGAHPPPKPASWPQHPDL